MRMLIAAKSGWGKSYVGQSYLEDNIKEFDHAIILDFKNEFRGLVKSGLASYVGVGQAEMGISVEGWRTIIEQNGTVVVDGEVLGPDTWREVATIIAKAARRVDGRVLVGVDEAHLVAPQDVKLPEAIKLLATTGRGKVSSIWITQRLQEIDEAVISQNNANLLGGFGSNRDRGKLDVEYPVEVHNPEADRVPNLPAELHHAEDGPVPLQKTEVNGVVRSSEWIYSTDEGEMERLDSASINMMAEHYGGSDQKLEHPF
ncbi:ATP-binding protein [Haloplanus rubicundus]|uniref:ATP-binding protein n=1 Tax=Haloplanus rubicundus TaxID=1547898 RepID=A0A345EBB3_9EURY|nr:ATP-binding protein [Haloplanus rubicundus]AXG09485.1 ATP-binding protein [Haloplanus rubicundus]